MSQTIGMICSMLTSSCIVIFSIELRLILKELWKIEDKLNEKN